MGYGQARVVEPTNNTTQDKVRNATEQAVRDAQNAGMSKIDVLRARDAAKERVLTGALNIVASGGSGGEKIKKELEEGGAGGLLHEARQFGLIDSQGQITNKVTNRRYEIRSSLVDPDSPSNPSYFLNSNLTTENPTNLRSQRFGEKYIDSRKKNLDLWERQDSVITNPVTHKVVAGRTRTGAIESGNVPFLGALDYRSAQYLGVDMAKDLPSNYPGAQGYEKFAPENNYLDLTLSPEIEAATNYIYDKADKVSNFGREELDKAGFVGDIIRGAITENIGGTIGLFGWTMETANLASKNLRNRGLAEAIDVIGYQTGTLAGGLEKGLLDDPVATVSGIVTPGPGNIAKHAGGITKMSPSKVNKFDTSSSFEPTYVNARLDNVLYNEPAIKLPNDSIKIMDSPNPRDLNRNRMYNNLQDKINETGSQKNINDFIKQQIRESLADPETYIYKPPGNPNIEKQNKKLNYYNENDSWRYYGDNSAYRDEFE